jgi:SAM-dependent methyltransferase
MAVGLARRIGANAVRAARPRTWRWLWRRLRTPTFLEFYAAYVDAHAAVDPVEAVGGRWDEIGALQCEFLLREGLRPDHAMLDVGCGALRGGRHFIRYLDPGKYFGVDISSVVLAAARRVMLEDQLIDKEPTLQLVSDTSFEWFGDRVFDVILAQSVFTHMRPADLGRVFAHVPRVMAAHTVFYATCFLGRDSLWRGMTGTTFAYPFDLFATLGARHGLEVSALREDQYPHPYGTTMLRITRRNSSENHGP